MNDPPVLYSRPRASEMLQSMVDTTRLLRYELDKFREFYPAEWQLVYYNGGLQSFDMTLQQFRNNNTYFNLEQAIHSLREKGL